MTLTKRDLVLRVYEDTKLPQHQVFNTVQATLDHILNALAKGEKVELRNFGVFEVRVHKARFARKPTAPEVTVAVPERCAVKFKAGREMRLAVRKLAPKLVAKPSRKPRKG